MAPERARCPSCGAGDGEVLRLQEENAALLDALRGLVNIATHPNATKLDIRTIATEARFTLARAGGPAPVRLPPRGS